MYELKSRRLSSQILTCFQKKNNDFIQKRNPSKKMLVEEELDYIDMDDIGNIEDSPRLAFIDEEYGNLIVVHDGGELILLEISTK